MTEQIKTSKEELIQYCRLILRKMGHSLPPAPWIETFTYPGTQLTNFCRHCKKPFGMIGNENGFQIVNIRRDEHFDTNKAWSERREPVVVRETIIHLSSIDFIQRKGIINWLMALSNGNPNAQINTTDEKIPADEVIKNKINQIDKRFYCPKISTWL